MNRPTLNHSSRRAWWRTPVTLLCGALMGIFGLAALAVGFWTLGILAILIFPQAVMPVVALPWPAGVCLFCGVAATAVLGCAAYLLNLAGEAADGE